MTNRLAPGTASPSGSPRPGLLAVACLVLGLAAVLAPAERPAGVAGEFRFAWLSDTHVGSPTAADDLRAAVLDINAMRDVRFVVVSGDVTEYGSLAQLTEARSILGGLRERFRIIAGNHDTKWSESGGTDVVRVFGHDRFAFDHGGYRFIGMHQGPVMKMGDGHFALEDVRWLDASWHGCGTVLSSS